MATRRQKAAARKNIKKAQAARKRMDNPTKKKSKGRKKTAAKRRTAAKRPTTRRAAAKRTIRTGGTVRVKARKPRRKSTQKLAVLQIVEPTRRKKSRAAAPPAAPRKRRKASRGPTKRRKAKKATYVARPRRAAAKRPTRKTSRRRVGGRAAQGKPSMTRIAANPTRRPRRAKKAASRKRAAARRRTTQNVRVRMKTKRVVLKRRRNPAHDFDMNPMMGFDDMHHNPLGGYGGLLDNPLGITSMVQGYYDNPINMYHDNPMEFEENPYEENPEDGGIAGAFSGENLKRYGVAAGGVAVGLIVADFLDRFVATRKPADDGEANKANQAWYGRDAAAAQRARPDAMRLGAQAVGAVGSVALAYQLRGKNFAPWIFGGLSLGFGANLLKMVADWYVMPAIFKVPVDEATKLPKYDTSFASRMYPLEQSAVQEQVKQLFTKWSGVAELKAAQTEKDPVISSPLSADTTTSVYTLGAPAQESLFAAPRVLGNAPCASCGGVGGCNAGCPTLCPGDCPQGVMPGQGDNKPLCRYTVKSGDDLLVMAASVNVAVEEITALNGNRSPNEYWAVGAEVTLPYELCAAIELGNAGRALPNLPPLPAPRNRTPAGAVIPAPQPGEPGGPPGPPTQEIMKANVIREIAVDNRISAIPANVLSVPTAGAAMSSPAMKNFSSFMSVRGNNASDVETLGAPKTDADREVALRSFGRDMADDA